ncbi:MAG: arginine--tRNA ligase [Vampirovibrionales bacterium]
MTLITTWFSQHCTKALSTWYHRHTPLQGAFQTEEEWLEWASPKLRFERPRHAEHGHVAVNVSFMAKHAKLAPPAIASALTACFDLTEHDGVLSPIAGFINLKLSPQHFASMLITHVRTCVLHEGRLPQNDALKDQSVLLEFVSANPTGPLHIGHGRWAALGDTLARLLQHCGATVHTEFYVNDYGKQMANLSASLWYRCLESLKLGTFPTPVEGEKFPFYPGDYVKDLAEAYLNDPTYGEPRKQAIRTLIETQQHTQAPLYQDSLELELRHFTQARMLDVQKRLLNAMGVTFHQWTMESTLHENGSVAAGIEKLKRSGDTYEEEGALWLDTSKYGDDKNRVLVKQDGTLTYLTADIAYHDEKCQRSNPSFTHLLNIWGADHHGYIPRMKAALEALGHDPKRLEILLGQLVTLKINGETTRMGKRRTMVTLEDLVEDVGKDAVRFWMVSRSSDTTLEFDVDLAASASQENPVFYVQYAHARCASILRHAFEPGLSAESHLTQKLPIADKATWLLWVQEFSTPEDVLTALFPSVTPEASDDTTALKQREAIEQLILLLLQCEDLLVDAATLRYPHLVVRYTQDVATAFHGFYNVCRILNAEDVTGTHARLLLVYWVKTVIASCLEVLGVDAPASM